MDYPNKPKSALVFLLKSLIPYTRENMQLSFHPHRFFNELEKLSGYSHKTFQNAVWRAQKEGLIEREGQLLKLTEQGKQKLQPFTPAKLGKNARLMVIFDIPEEDAYIRRRLRLLLREWRFVQVQKSVWVSDFDSKKVLVKAIEELDAKRYVQVYECAKLYPKK